MSKIAEARKITHAKITTFTLYFRSQILERECRVIPNISVFQYCWLSYNTAMFWTLEIAKNWVILVQDEYSTAVLSFARTFQYLLEYSIVFFHNLQDEGEYNMK